MDDKMMNKIKYKPDSSENAVDSPGWSLKSHLNEWTNVIEKSNDDFWDVVVLGC